VLVVHKIGAPGNPEYGIGAIAEGNARVLNKEALRALCVSQRSSRQRSRMRAEVDARVACYRGTRRPLAVEGRTAIVVDDGLATGGTARAALRAVRARSLSRLVLAVPVGAPEAVTALEDDADDVVCPLQPEVLWAVGACYENFDPTRDEEVIRLLAREAADPPARRRDVRELRIAVADDTAIVADLELPT
jgi:putative phosphoribosyl transferase